MEKCRNDGKRPTSHRGNSGDQKYKKGRNLGTKSIKKGGILNDREDDHIDMEQKHSVPRDGVFWRFDPDV